MDATRSDVVTAYRELQGMMHGVIVDADAKYLSFESPSLPLAERTSKETAPSILDRVLAVHTVTKAREHAPCIVVESKSGATD